MTDERDPKVSAVYRELGTEEPARTLDDAILAAARRSARPWTKRWAAPLSLAAVIVLSVTVTLRIQHEQPGIEAPVQQAAAPAAEKEAVKEVAKPAAADEVKIARRKSAEQTAPSLAAVPPAPAASEPKPFAAEQAASSASARSDESRGAPASVAGAPAKRAEAQATSQALKPAESPERDLDRIAELRGQGRHEEADKALAEFRKRYPDFRIPDAMRERIERR